MRTYEYKEGILLSLGDEFLPVAGMFVTGRRRRELRALKPIRQGAPRPPVTTPSPYSRDYSTAPAKLSLEKLAGPDEAETPIALSAPPSPGRGDGGGGVVEACVICLQAITERAITVPCNHYTFDFICIASWLNERSTCPLCNEEITQVQYDWRAPHDYKTYRVTSTKEKHDQDNSRGTLASARTRQTDEGRRRRQRVLQRRAHESVRTEEAAVLRRRHVYRRQLYSLHVGSNRVSCYRELTAHAFAAGPDLQSRARRWIRRELQVFRYLNHPVCHDASASPPRARATNAEFLLEYIIAILKTVDVKAGDGKAEDLLTEFLGRRDARLFLHELSAWLRSPYSSLHDWDEHVQYSERLPADAPGNTGRRVVRVDK